LENIIGWGSIGMNPTKVVNNGVQLGDAIEEMAKLPGQIIDLTVADPPFNIDFEYDDYDDKMAPDEYLFWSESWMRQVYRLTRPHGTFWLCIGDAYVSELDVLAKRLGWHKRSHVIWYFTFGPNQKKNFVPSHVHLLYYVKNPKRFTFNFKDVRVPSARQLVYNDKRAKPGGRAPDNTWILRPQDIEGLTVGENTWYVSRVCGTFKERIPGAANQMPEEVVARIIKACSNPDDLVLDPFSGTATTAVVAQKLGRNYLTYEISKKWAEIGTKRIMQETD